MKNIILSAMRYIRSNLTLAYSLALVLLIPLILFAATYYNISLFEKNFNHLLQTKAQLLENVFVAMINDEELEGGVLQEKIEMIIEQNSDVAQIKILDFDEGQKAFSVIASSKTSEIGEASDDFKDGLAIGRPEGIASVVSEFDERFWEVSKPIRTESGRLLVIKTKLSLQRVDEAFAQSVRRAYMILVLSSIVLVLLVTNYARLSRYVFLFNKMKEVDQMKDNFISMASHELKTPLTAITGYIDLLQSGAGKKMNEEDKGFLDKIQISTDRLRSLVSDLLEVSRLEQNRIPFKPAETKGLEIVEKVVGMLDSRAKEKKLKLYIDSELKKDETKIFVDPERFEQILVNLVGNSLKYTLKGEVKVHVFEEKGRVVFSVEDTGIGMNSQQREKLFAKFYRIKSSKTKGVEGTGLGLWITKDLVEKMKGKIGVESMEGVGSKFIVSFKKK